MIVVRVELHSAVTRQVTELARMEIANTGQSTSMRVCDYVGKTLRGRDKATLDRGVKQREGEVLAHRRLDLHVWHLVAKMLTSLGYGER